MTKELTGVLDLHFLLALRVDMLLCQTRSSSQLALLLDVPKLLDERVFGYGFTINLELFNICI